MTDKPSSINNTESETPYESGWVAFAFLMIAAALGYQIWVMTLPMEVIVAKASVDDTYLYLEVARNWSLNGFPSFDGVTATNGIQPLWGYLLVLIGKVAPGSEAFVRTTGMICAFLNALSTLSLFFIARQMRGQLFASFCAILLSLYFLFTNSIAMMETNLHGVVFCFVLYFGWRLTQKKVSEWSLKDILPLGAILTLNGFCRLDSGIISAMIWCVIAVLMFKEKRWKLFIPLTLPAIIFLTPYLLLNYINFGGFTPISGKAKIVWAYQMHELTMIDHLNAYGHAIVRMFTANFIKSSGVPYLRIQALIIFYVIVFLTGFLTLMRRGQMPKALLLLWIMFGIHSVIMAILLREFSAAYWYYQPLRITYVITCALILSDFIKRLPTCNLPAGFILGALAVLTGVMAVKNTALPKDEDTRLENFYYARYKAATWISQTDELDSEANIGSWNAGQLGYFSEPRPIVNLDGLVMDKAFLEEVLKTGNWKEYFQKRNIRYLVDYDVLAGGRQNFDHSKPDDEYFRGLIPNSQLRIVKRFGVIEIIDISEWLESSE